MTTVCASLFFVGSVSYDMGLKYCRFLPSRSIFLFKCFNITVHVTGPVISLLSGAPAWSNLKGKKFYFELCKIGHFAKAGLFSSLKNSEYS